MSETVDEAAQRSRYWSIPVLRAVPAAIVALIITFSSNHAAEYGLLLFGSYAVVEGIIVLVGSRRLAGRTTARISRIQGVLTVIAGIVAFPLIGVGIYGLIVVVAVFAVLTGALELVQGIRVRKSSPFARDWSTVGVLTLLLAIAYVLTPPRYTEQLGGVEHVSGTLDSPIILVGFLGAYLALTAVFHVIAGLSHKWGTAVQTPATSNGAPHA